MTLGGRGKKGDPGKLTACWTRVLQFPPIERGRGGGGLAHGWTWRTDNNNYKSTGVACRWSHLITLQIITLWLN